jgi:protein-L-isoaspartate(D-aspartate) O-methyltransferase
MWRTVASSNTGLIQGLVSNGVFKSTRVKEAMLATDRGLYCKDVRSAYHDSPQLTESGQTISAPHSKKRDNN